MLESEIENTLRKRIKALKNGVQYRKFVSPGYTGVPDRVILLPGAHVIFVELKQPGKKERKRQEYVQEQFRQLGFEVYSSVRTIEQINAIVERCKEVLQGEGLYST
jgi:hypothetical protein